MERRRIALLALAGICGLGLWVSMDGGGTTPAPTSKPAPLVKPKKPLPEPIKPDGPKGPKRPHPGPGPEPCPGPGPWGPHGCPAVGRVSDGLVGQISEGGPVGPEGQEVAIDLPADQWKHNITSVGQGCCVFRSIDHAAHWQGVPVLYGFPEWLRDHHMPGGGYPGNVKERIAAISQDRGEPEPAYLQYEGGRDTAILEAALQTGRMPGVTYDGHDGIHYNGPIAHMVNLVYLDEKTAAILDNNFPPDKLLWMSRDDFIKRWSGWAVVLLAPRPPSPPRN